MNSKATKNDLLETIKAALILEIDFDDPDHDLVDDCIARLADHDRALARRLANATTAKGRFKIANG